MDEQPKNRLEIGLSPRVAEIVKYIFDNPGLTQRQLAEHFGVSQARISVITNHPKVLEAYPILAKRKLKGMVPKAIKRFNELLEQKQNPEVSRKVTMSALEAAKVLENEQKITVEHRFESMNTSKLAEFLTKSQQQLGNVIDVEAVDDPPAK